MGCNCAGNPVDGQTSVDANVTGTAAAGDMYDNLPNVAISSSEADA